MKGESAGVTPFWMKALCLLVGGTGSVTSALTTFVRFYYNSLVSDADCAIFFVVVLYTIELSLLVLVIARSPWLSRSIPAPLVKKSTPSD